MNDMTSVQRAIEASAVEQGIARYRQQQQKCLKQGRPEDGASVRRLLRDQLEPFETALQGLIDDASGGKAGRHHAVVPYLKHLSAGQAALLTSRAVFADLLKHGGRRRIQRVMVAIGREVVTQALLSDYANKQPDDYQRAYRRASQSSNAKRARTVLVYCANRQVEGIHWPEQVVMAVGGCLLELMAASTGLIELHDTSEGVARGFVTEVRINPQVSTWLSESDAALELARPLHLPMVVPPKDWTGPFDGGYLTREARTGCAIHTSVRGFVADLPNHWEKFQQHFDSVNLLQQVPWRINRSVLAVAERTWKGGGGLTDCLPTRAVQPLPPKVAGYDADETKLRAWKRSAAKVYDAEVRRTSTCIGAGALLRVAGEFQEYPAIYFPHYCDFRGRVYTLTTDLTPQGNDLAKGLLDFAEGQEIRTDLDVFWFAVNGANLYGIDKVSFEERVQWTSDNSNRIRAFASDLESDDLSPEQQAWWLAADKPWQFAAWAIEWMNFHAQGRGFVTHRRVDLDGSCNGLQHFAALLRDRTTGAAVNLVPSDRPNDLYQQVADAVAKRLEIITCDCTIDDEGRSRVLLASQWLAWGIDRKMTKRPVMVLPYGGTIASTKQYVRSAYLEGVAKGKPCHWEDRTREMFMAVNFLASVIWEVLGDILPAALNAMKWLQASAAACTKRKLPVQWATPDGFVVHQAYPNMEQYRISLYTPVTIYKAKPRRDITLQGATLDGSLNARQQRQGVSPNFVHSLDACHLAMLVRAAVGAGITSMACVHDSYGCLAPQVEQFASIIREQFVELYKADVLGGYRTQIEAVTLDALAPVPVTGDLDIAAIAGAEYAFA